MKTVSLLFIMALVVNIAYAGKTSNEFKNPTVGFAVSKPDKWQFVTADQHMENLSRTHLNDQEVQAAIQKYATAPLVVMMKYPEPYDDLNPSFKANVKPLGNLPADDPLAILKLIIVPMEKMFKDFTIVRQPSETKVADLKAAHVRIHYSLQIPDGRIFPTASDLWIVPRGKFFFLLGAGTRQDEKTGSREEIQNILSTIVIEK